MGPARRAAALVLLAGAAWVGEARALPQATVDLLAGGGVRGAGGGEEGAFRLGLRGDVLFFRTRNRDVAVGPYLEGSLTNLRHGALGGGLSVLLPLGEDWPLVASLGPLAYRPAGGPWRQGIGGQLFFGRRSYNHAAAYSLTGGLFVDGRVFAEGGAGSPSGHEVVGGFQLDMAFLALPVLLLVNAFR